MIKMCVRRVLNAYQLASMGKNTVVSYLASRSFFCLGFLLVFSHINITNRCKCNLHCCFYCRILILFCQFLFFFFLYFVKSSLWVIKKTHRRSFLRPFFHGAKTIEIFFSNIPWRHTPYSIDQFEYLTNGNSAHIQFAMSAIDADQLDSWKARINMLLMLAQYAFSKWQRPNATMFLLSAVSQWFTINSRIYGKTYFIFFVWQRERERECRKQENLFGKIYWAYLSWFAFVPISAEVINYPAMIENSKCTLINVLFSIS